LWEKKDKHCDPSKPADRTLGSWWDHVLIDVESRLIVSLVVGRRVEDTAYAVWVDFFQRTEGDFPEVITTDGYAVYYSVIVSIYGVHKDALELTEAQKAEVGWEQLPEVYVPVEMNYATVQKQREKGRVVEVRHQVVLGTAEQLAEALAEEDGAQTITTNHVERWFGTQRHLNARKVRKTYTFSKDYLFHVAVTWLCVVFYNFGWTPRTLRVQVKEEPPEYHYRTPAMVAGLATEPWPLERILRYPVFTQKSGKKDRKARRKRKMRLDGG
jgi:hypothetical protein